MTRPFRNYTAYGLHIRSLIDLPFAPLPGSATGEPDVNIFFGKTPETIQNPVTKCEPKYDWQSRWEAAKEAFLIDIPGVARYFVTGGRDITISSYDGCSDHDIGAFLVGKIFGALLQQRGLTILHASGIMTETGAVLFTGPSGIGKSSLLATLLNHSYPLVTDDLGGVTLDAGGRPTVLPAFPYIRLRNDTLDRVEWSDGALTPVRKGSEKYSLPVERFHLSPTPLRAVYILTHSDVQDVRIESLPLLHAFKYLYEHTYRKRIMFGLGQRGSHLRILGAVSREVRVSLVKRPGHQFLLDMLKNRILADLREELLSAGNDAAAGQAVSRTGG